MFRRLTLLVVLSSAALGLVVPTADAGTSFTRTLSVTGTGAGMYPAFAPGTTRYAATTDATTGGTLTVDASTTDPAGTVLVDGELASGPTQVSGLNAGDEVSVIIDDADGRTPYSVMYLPNGFPELDATTNLAGVQAGYVGLTLNTFEATPLQAYDAIVDRNGVPVWAVAGAQQDLDLKQQPNGQLTISRLSTLAGHTGASLVTLDDQLVEGSRQDVAAPLTNTDGHDALKLADGTTVLLGYEPNPVTHLTDATIQEQDANGTPTFTWSSASLAGESAASSGVQGAAGDYAHVNSVWPASDGDLIVSFRHLSAVLRIATTAHDGYAAGDIVWKLGGRDSSFTFVDDPYGGPCAQHTASQLANGDILVFDNGTSGLCVDQSDPTGPTISRGATRVAEYKLDTVAHTATLVWSYAPSDTYAFFAGSARRMANGNTLIGWADDRDDLATEVAPDKQVLWNLRAPAAVAGHKKYMTYRAELITDLTDMIKPDVTVTGPAESSTFVVGDVVPVSSRCTDRGGSNLSTCTMTGVTGSNLNTSTAGPRTWTATATDGNGNTTTVTRHYTVRAPVRLVDGLVRRAGSSSWIGNDVRPSTSHQIVTVSARRGQAATAYWLVRNDGERTDALTLYGAGGSGRTKIRYWSNGRDVTRAVMAGTFRTASLAPGASTQLRIVTVPTRRSRVGSTRTFVLVATSTAASSAVDRVAIRLATRR